jgi:hypothetical protein
MVKKRIKKRWSRYAGAAAIIIAAGAGIMTYSGGKDAQNPVRIPDAVLTLLLLDADIDFGRLPARTDWCSGSDHCWLFGGSGTVSDTGDATAWDLTANGSPRTGVVTGVPVDDGSGSVDWTVEQGAWLDRDTSNYYNSANEMQAQSSFSVTAVFFIGATGATTHAVYHQNATSGRYAVGTQSGDFFFFGDDDSANVTASAPVARIGWHCVTYTYTSGQADGVDIFANGSDLSATGDTSLMGGIDAKGALEIPRDDSAYIGWAQSRVRLDFGTALTLAQHQSLCGSLNQPVRSDHPAVADISWTQTGGTRCFDVGSNRAYCAPGGKAAYAYSSALDAVEGESGFGWVVEPGRINRVTNNTAIAANWTIRGAATATDGQVAPDGSATATSVSLGASGVDDILGSPEGGYTASSTVYPRLWVKCSTGNLTVASRLGTPFGEWDITCSTFSNGVWKEAYSGSQTGINEVNA